MPFSHASPLLIGSIVAFMASVVGVARAQSMITISMSEPPTTPQLQAPFVVSSLPSAPFLFGIPATGKAPLTFTATGLPAGLTLSSSSGIISGTMPVAGSYPVTITLTNAVGTASATYTLVSGTTLALTPPMGWNSYDSFGASVTEQDMLDEAQAVRTYLQPFGWNYVVIDYRWYEPGQPIDGNGRYLPATSKYPSATGSTGFKALADRIHALGLGFGIHIMRGVPRKSYDANLPIAGSSYTTRDAGDANDACPWDTHMWGVRGDTPAGQAWYDALFAQYAAWGIDFVKIDDMLNNTTRQFHQAEADAIRRAIDKTGRPIVLSLSPGPDDPSWLPNSASNLNRNATMWRVVNDFWDFNALTDLPGVFREANAWQAVTTLTPGHWPDLDMLPLGYLGPRNEWHASGQTTFSHNEQVTIMTLWSIFPSPLMFGGNPSRLSSDTWTRALLTNPEVLAINQDALGARARRTTTTGGELWVRDLSGGRKAVGFFNRGTQDANMSATFAQMGVNGTVTVRDVWRRSDVTTANNALSASVPAGAALLYVVTPASSNGGSGGASGAGGEGAGGASNPAGGSASAGASNAGGAPINAGGTVGSGGGASNGGTLGSGGTSNAAGASGANVAGASEPRGGAANGGVGAIAGANSAGATFGGTLSAGGSLSESGGTLSARGGSTNTGGTTPTSGENQGCGCSVPGRRAPFDFRFALAALFTAIGLRRRSTATRSRHRCDAPKTRAHHCDG